jgi:hypothetical protein
MFYLTLSRLTPFLFYLYVYMFLKTIPLIKRLQLTALQLKLHIQYFLRL